MLLVNNISYSVLFLVHYLLLTVFSSPGPSHFLPRNYLIQDNLLDGEHEVRVHFDGISSRQTYVGPKEGSPDGLLVRQLSDGVRLLSLIYNGYLGSPEDAQPDASLELRDCDFTSDSNQLEEYLDLFADDALAAERAAHGGWKGDFANSSYVHLGALDDIPRDLRPLVHYKTLKSQCKYHHKKVRKSMKTMKRLNHLENSNNGRSRARRSLREMFILPGTKWCGNNNLARRNELDGYSRADECCRSHDNCPFNINGISNKYHLYNTRLTTISHCACDIRFRTCLKHARTGAANVVGNVFFNLMNTNCFVFKREKTCIKYGWWGKCKEWARQKRAVLKDPVPWQR